MMRVQAPVCSLPVAKVQSGNIGRQATRNSSRLPLCAHWGPERFSGQSEELRGSAVCRSRLRRTPGCTSSSSVVVCGPVSHPGEERQDQREFPAGISIPATCMARGVGSFGGSATLERSKLDMRQKVRETAPKLDDSGGGGNIGKGIFNGGGGEGDGGDDDDYFGDGGEDGDGDENFFRRVIQELYDRETILAVMKEWCRDISNLPEFIQKQVEMGVYSSAALVRFFSMDVRPNVTRALARKLNPSMTREVVGRLMADPAFAQKMVIEQLITISGSLIWEAKQRGDRFFKELDLVAINTLSLAVSQAALVWLVSPTRSMKLNTQMPWQRLLSDLPNHAFENSTKFHQFSLHQRLVSVFTKATELAAVGTLSGAAMWGLSNTALAIRRSQDPGFVPSVPVPSLQASVGGMAAALAVIGNARYQAICGMDRWLFDHSSMLWSYLTMSGVGRVVTHTYLNEPARLSLLGLPIEAPQRPMAVPVGFAPLPAPERPRAARPRSAVRRTKRRPASGFEMSLVGSGSQ